MSGGGPPIEVAAGLVFRDGKLLITQRPPGSHLGGLWEFPGGKCEAGESFEQCLRRELAEELGIEVQVHELAEELTHHYAERSVHLKFYRCRWLRHEPRAILCHDWAWIGPEQLPDYRFPAADARLLEKLRSDWRHASEFPAS
jgi:mutator protein MutT